MPHFELPFFTNLLILLVDAIITSTIAALGPPSFCFFSSDLPLQATSATIRTKGRKALFKVFNLGALKVNYLPNK